MVAIVGVVVTQEQEVGATQEAVEVTREAVEVTREAVEVTWEAVEVTQEAVEVTQEAVEVTRDTEVEVIQVPEVMEAAAGQVGSGILGDTGQHAPGKNVYLVIWVLTCDEMCVEPLPIW